MGLVYFTPLPPSKSGIADYNSELLPCFDGVFVGSVNNCDTRPTTLPVKKGSNTLELQLPSLDLPYNTYFLSLKAYTEKGGPDWGPGGHSQPDAPVRHSDRPNNPWLDTVRRRIAR
jgi:hypothetical protein